VATSTAEGGIPHRLPVLPRSFPLDLTEQTLYLQEEALGSVGLVTDNKGGEVERTYFDPFGEKVNALGEPIAPHLGDVKLGFTGHRHDDELGLIDHAFQGHHRTRRSRESISSISHITPSMS
jgi:hypothetical protein